MDNSTIKFYFIIIFDNRYTYYYKLDRFGEDVNL